jgi:hypothetical protein
VVESQEEVLGTLRIYPAAYNPPQPEIQGTATALDEKTTLEIRLALKHRVGSNMTGTHTGDIFEEAVVMTC